MNDKPNEKGPPAEAVGVVEPSVVGIITREEIDVAIATAKKYPRSIVQFKADLLALATLDEDTAVSMRYQLPPRKGSDKLIEGESVRLAEAAAYAYQNIRYGGRCIEVRQTEVVAQGVAYDTERNVGPVFIEIPRKILRSDGTRFSEDMINVTERAAIAIAKREAILSVIPRALVREAYLAAKEVALGKGLTMEQRRERAFKWFEDKGVKRDRILELLDRRGADDVTVDDLHMLTGLRTAITDGEVTLEEVFPPPAARRRPETVVTASAILGGKVEAREDSPPRQEAASPPPTPALEREVAMAPAPKLTEAESLAAANIALRRLTEVALERLQKGESEAVILESLSVAVGPSAAKAVMNTAIPLVHRDPESLEPPPAPQREGPKPAKRGRSGPQAFKMIEAEDPEQARIEAAARLFGGEVPRETS